MAQRTKALTRALAVVGGVARLAEHLGVTAQAVSQWKTVPVERVLTVERLTGMVVSRSEMRPDIYPRDGGGR